MLVIDIKMVRAIQRAGRVYVKCELLSLINLYVSKVLVGLL